ncbi:uncharacterized protein LOC131949236 [Physella acuta]|uniref:uncharacterized protein LOC131949236 n=1 Tax=Physella acuta TaxID=109671 RepID=UPI0027DEA6E4|nr:uncharacterized protein LOC131949236 [Physella acuta]
MPAVNAPVPSCGCLEVVFSFDTTGSMYTWLEQVRGRIQDMIQRLQADIPGIRMAVFAHGDYCDVDTYVTKWIDFTTDVAQLCKFVKNAEQTEGGDAPECYELVLKQVRTELSWTPGSRRVLVLIGDDNPHEPNEDCNKDKVNWRDETKNLAVNDVTIYGVQCGQYNTEAFYKTISIATNGKHLRLDDFGSIFDTLMAVCYRESHDTAMLVNYEKEVRARYGDGKLAMDIDAIFASLRDEVNATPTLSVTSPTPKKRARLTPTSAGLLPKMKKAKSLKPDKKIRAKTKTVDIVSKTTMPAEPKTLFSKKKSINSLLNKYKLKNLPLLKRENVPEINFNLRTLNWRPWFLALNSDEPNINKTLWQRRDSKPGYTLKTLPTTKLMLPSYCLFEVSVQHGGAKSKKYPVFSKFSGRCFETVHWEKRLLGSQSAQIENALQAGCKIYIRYCVVGSNERKEIVKSLKRYDYAWENYKNIRSGARDVVKGGIKISMQ